MGIYDIISQIAQKECNKVYTTKISIGIVDLDAELITINDLDFDFEDVIFTETALNKILVGRETVVCINTESCIFIIDGLGVLD